MRITTAGTHQYMTLDGRNDETLKRNVYSDGTEYNSNDTLNQWIKFLDKGPSLDVLGWVSNATDKKFDTHALSDQSRNNSISFTVVNSTVPTPN